MNESDIIMLINYLHAIPQRIVPVPGGGDPQKVDEYGAILTNAQRNLVVESLRSYRAKP